MCARTHTYSIGRIQLTLSQTMFVAVVSVSRFVLLWWLFVGTCTCRLTANVFRHDLVSTLSWKQPANVIERVAVKGWVGVRTGRKAAEDVVRKCHR